MEIVIMIRLKLKRTNRIFVAATLLLLFTFTSIFATYQSSKYLDVAYASYSGSNESGSNNSGSNESGSNNSGSNESGSNNSGSNESGSNNSGSNESVGFIDCGMAIANCLHKSWKAREAWKEHGPGSKEFLAAAAAATLACAKVPAECW
jgi:hypothetical protein